MQLSPFARFAHAMCVYAEPLVRARRVVVVGDASIGLADRLLELGARTVHLYDPLVERARAHAGRVARGASIRELPQGEFDVRDGAFDVALVPDLAVAVEPAALLARLRRLVGGAGAVLASARNPETPREAGETAGIEYAELYDLLSLQFENVRMLAQMPFEGLAIAELGDEDDSPAVSVDTQLVESPPSPRRYLALASDADVQLDAYAIVQTPAGPPPSRPSLDDSQAVIAGAQLKAELLEAQLEEQRALSRRHGIDAHRVPLLEKELAETTERLQVAERRAAEHQQRAESLVAEQRRIQEEAQRVREAASRSAMDAESTRRASQTGTRRIAELEDALAKASGVEAALRYKMAELATVPQVDPDAIRKLAERADHAERLQARLELDVVASDEVRSREAQILEEQLRERGKKVADLQSEIARRDKMIRELVGALEEASAARPDAPAAVTPPAPAPVVAPPPPAPVAKSDDAQLRAKLDKLALELARREGELQARAWRITELEQQLAQSPAAEGGRVAALEKELDVLRRALAQEHEARKQIESGDALRKAQSELARQATLIEQLSRELDQRQRASS